MPKCSVRTYNRQPITRPSLPQPGPHNPLTRSNDSQQHHVPSGDGEGNSINGGGGGGGASSKTGGMGGQCRGSEPSRDGHSSSMEYSDSESGSASVSPVWENTHLRTSKVEGNVEGSKATGAVSQCQQDQAGVMLPPTQHRHLDMPEHNIIPREVGGENLSETTDSEESADLLPEACDGHGAKNARVNLKRKLENASESERSEKYLIRDVGNLQLG